MDELRITSEQVNGALVIRLVGEPHIHAGAPLHEMVSSTVGAQPGKVVVDLTGLQFISSQIAGRLVQLQTFLKRQGGQAVIAGPNKIVKDALTRMRTVTVIPVFETMDEALAG